MMVRSIIQALWVGAMGLQILLAAALLSRRSWLKFPIFTCYVILNLVEGAAGYLLQTHRSAYLYTYIVGEALSIVLGLGLVYEIFSHLFQPHAALRRLAVVVFRIAASLLLILAVGVVYLRGPFSANDVLAFLFIVEEAARIMEVGLLMSLFLFSSIFGLHWRQFVFGIALGLGVSVTVKLAEVTLLPHVPSPAAAALVLGGMLAFVASLFVWIAYTVAPERITQAIELPKTAQLERWNQAIMELIHQ